MGKTVYEMGKPAAKPWVKWETLHKLGSGSSFPRDFAENRMVSFLALEGSRPSQ